MPNKLISIIIPCYNAQEYIGKAIESALSQTYSNIEIIVVDDSSSDDSLSVVKSFSSKIRIVELNRSGPGKARNAGVRNAKGELIAFLDADDTIDKNFVKYMVSFLAANPDASYCYSQMKVHGAQNGVAKTIDFDPGFLLLKSNFIGIGVIIPKQIFLDVGGFDESLSAFEDWDIWLKLLSSGHKGKLLKKPLYNWYFHSSVSRNQLNLPRHSHYHRLLLRRYWRLVPRYGIPFYFGRFVSRLGFKSL